MSCRKAGLRHVLLCPLLFVCLAACGESAAVKGGGQVDLVVEYDTTEFISGEEVDVKYTVNNRTWKAMEVYRGQWRHEYALRLSEDEFAEKGQEGHYEVYGTAAALRKQRVAGRADLSWDAKTGMPKPPGVYAVTVRVGSSVGQLSATHLIEVRDVKGAEAK